MFRTKIALVVVTEGRGYVSNAKGGGPTCKIVDEVGDWIAGRPSTITATKANLSTSRDRRTRIQRAALRARDQRVMGIGGFTSKFVDVLKIP